MTNCVFLCKDFVQFGLKKKKLEKLNFIIITADLFKNGSSVRITD